MNARKFGFSKEGISVALTGLYPAAAPGVLTSERQLLSML